VIASGVTRCLGFVPVLLDIVRSARRVARDRYTRCVGASAPFTRHDESRFSRLHDEMKPIVMKPPS
jgi:hypothetical protein